jgi:hypothetical protein
MNPLLLAIAIFWGLMIAGAGLFYLVMWNRKEGLHQVTYGVCAGVVAGLLFFNVAEYLANLLTS